MTSAALGLRWFVSDDVSLGGAFEIPVTDREDVLDQRVTVDLVLRF